MQPGLNCVLHPRLVALHFQLFNRIARIIQGDEMTRNRLRAIVGFEVEITRLEGKLKLGQNRSSADRAGGIAGLLEQGDAVGIEVARLMRATESPEPSNPAAAQSTNADDGALTKKEGTSCQSFPR